MSKFWSIYNAANSRVQLYIYGDIVGGQWDKWSDDDTAPADFVTALDKAGGRPIDLYINSPGGSVAGGLAIYHQLSRYSGHITAHVDGVAASISSVIMMAANEIHIPSNAQIMIHDPINLMIGYFGSDDLRTQADRLDAWKDIIADIYTRKMVEPDAESIKGLMADETWMTGDEAAAVFNVTVSEPVKAVALAHGLTRFSNAPDAVKAEGAHTPPVEEVTKEFFASGQLYARQTELRWNRNYAYLERERMGYHEQENA